MLNKYIVVKYSELHLKGKNKKEFSNILIRNIKTKIEEADIDAIVKDGRDRIFIYSDSDLDKVMSVLKYVVGIASFSYYYECNSDKEEIESIIKENIGEVNDKKFRVSAKLINNDLFENKDKMIEWLAWLGTSELKMKINLKNYDIDINVRIENEKATLFFDKEKGIIGLPAGSNGKALALLSGGIDSPVAAFKTISRGMNVSFLTFLTPRTSSSDTIGKILELAKNVNKYNGISGKLFLVNFEKVQEEIMKLEDTSYRIILLRRYFMRFAQLLSKKQKFKFVITGDSLGQVASQTPESMTQINNATDQLIIRPLVSMSKNEIIEIAMNIRTYETSIKPGDDMCSIFTPSNPIIFPKKEMVEKLESKLANIDEVLKNVFDKDMRIIELKEK